MKKRVIVVGASAGGVSALRNLVAELPVDINAAVFIVLHVRADHRSYLCEILQSQTALSVQAAKDGEIIAVGQIRVATPDHHLIVEQEHVLLTRGPRENWVRPSIDVLFRSAAYAHGPLVIGVVLSGALHDGSAGLWWIKNLGGTAIVQDPTDAEYPSMPKNAVFRSAPDYVLPVVGMGALIGRLTLEAVP